MVTLLKVQDILATAKEIERENYLASISRLTNEEIKVFFQCERRAVLLRPLWNAVERASRLALVRGE